MKACSRCGIAKPAEAFDVRRDRPIGRTAACKDCLRAGRRANPTGPLADTKTCTTCGRVLPRTVEYFHAHRPAKDGLKPRCKACQKGKSREHYEANSERIKANAARWGKEHPERRSVYVARWDRAHPEKKADLANDKRARDSGVLVERISRAKVYMRDGGVCGICGEHVPSDQVSVDHIVPLSLGGLHAYANVQLAHRLCNYRKGNRV